MPTKKYEKFLMQVAKTVSKGSNCKSRQIGSVLYAGKGRVAQGYNCYPGNMCDDGCRREEFGSGERLDLCPAVHSEISAVLNALKMRMNTQGSILYCFCGLPCKDCMKELIYCGVKAIVCLRKDSFEREKMTGYNFKLSRELAIKAGIKVYFMNEDEIDD